MNRKTPTLTAATNVVVAIVCCVVIFATGNPLGLLGLFFLQNIPVFSGQTENTEIEEDDDPKIGFTADMDH